MHVGPVRHWPPAAAACEGGPGPRGPLEVPRPVAVVPVMQQSHMMTTHMGTLSQLTLVLVWFGQRGMACTLWGCC